MSQIIARARVVELCKLTEKKAIPCSYCLKLFECNMAPPYQLLNKEKKRWELCTAPLRKM